MSTRGGSSKRERKCIRKARARFSSGIKSDSRNTQEARCTRSVYGSGAVETFFETKIWNLNAPGGFSAPGPPLSLWKKILINSLSKFIILSVSIFERHTFFLFFCAAAATFWVEIYKNLCVFPPAAMTDVRMSKKKQKKKPSLTWVLKGGKNKESQSNCLFKRREAGAAGIFETVFHSSLH